MHVAGRAGKKDFHSYFSNFYESYQENPEINLFKECTTDRLGNLHCVEVSL